MDELQQEVELQIIRVVLAHRLAGHSEFGVEVKSNAIRNNVLLFANKLGSG